MTKLEAIAFFMDMDECTHGGSEPIQMAIKALEQDSILDILNKLKAEIEQTEINGHIRDVECFRAGINVALNVIDKYKAGEEE